MEDWRNAPFHKSETSSQINKLINSMSLFHQQPLPLLSNNTCTYMSEQHFQIRTGSHLPTPDSTLKLVTVRQCQQSDFSTESENTAIVGLLLTIRHISMNADHSRTISTNTSSRYTAGFSTASRMRLSGSNSRPYDRIAMFADVLDSNGACFALIFQNHSDSFKFFQPCIKTLEGIGEVFVLEEPDPVKSYLGDTQSVPLVDRCDRALPLIAASIIAVPTVPITSPPVGHTKYFCQHNLRDLKIGRVYVQKASCGGVFCDRQQELVNNQKCGCFFTNKESNIVLSLDVTLTVPASFNISGQRTIQRFKSWRTSRLFVNPDSWKPLLTVINDEASDRKYRSMLRQAVKRVVDYVNDKGGWTCVGWVKTGTIQDESDITGATIASVEQEPHLTYLFPTSGETILSTSQYKTLRFNHNQVNEDTQTQHYQEDPDHATI